MQLTLLGTGVPNPNPKRHGPAQVVRAGLEAILIDCGSGAVNRLVAAGLSPGDVNHLLITHHHSDHSIDLGHFLISRWIMGASRPLHVYGPERLNSHIDRLLDLHAYDLEMRNRIRTHARPLPEVVVREIDEGRVFELDGLDVTAFLVEHPPIEQAFGFRFDGKDQSIVFSGDTRPCENLIKHAHGADTLVHECMEISKIPFHPGSGWDSREDQLSAIGSYHTTPTQLGLIAKDAAVGLLVTTHMLPASDPWELREIISHDYPGPLVIGEDLVTV